MLILITEVWLKLMMCLEQTECFPAALTHFKKGFGDASEKCDSNQFPIGQTKETLEQGLTRKQCMPQVSIHRVIFPCK